MKIDEVVLVTTANPAYMNCWAPVSEVWKTRFGVRPILFFVGTDEEYDTAVAAGSLPSTHGPVYHLAYDKPFENPSRPWEAPTALFWAASYAPTSLEDPIRLIAGIDRMPLFPALDRLVAGYSREQYVLSFCGAYTRAAGVNWAKGWDELVHGRYPYYPSEWVVGAQSTHQRMLGVEFDFPSFIDRVGKMDLVPMFNGIPGRWGLDEAYLAHQMHAHREDPVLQKPFDFWQTACSHRRLQYGRNFTPEEIRAGTWVTLNGGWADTPRDPWTRRVVDAVPVWH